MKKIRESKLNAARPKDPPRQSAAQKPRWQITEVDEGVFVADSGTGIRFFSDEREKLARWLQGEM